jgi:hypothetical protein
MVRKHCGPEHSREVRQRKGVRLPASPELEAHFAAKASNLGGINLGTQTTCSANFPDVLMPRSSRVMLLLRQIW